MQPQKLQVAQGIQTKFSCVIHVKRWNAMQDLIVRGKKFEKKQHASAMSLFVTSENAVNNLLPET